MVHHTPLLLSVQVSRVASHWRGVMGQSSGHRSKVTDRTTELHGWFDEMIGTSHCHLTETSKDDDSLSITFLNSCFSDRFLLLSFQSVIYNDVWRTHYPWSVSFFLHLQCPVDNSPNSSLFLVLSDLPSSRIRLQSGKGQFGDLGFFCTALMFSAFLGKERRTEWQWRQRRRTTPKSSWYQKRQVMAFFSTIKLMCSCVYIVTKHEWWSFQCASFPDWFCPRFRSSMEWTNNTHRLHVCLEHALLIVPKTFLSLWL